MAYISKHYRNMLLIPYHNIQHYVETNLIGPDMLCIELHSIHSDQQPIRSLMISLSKSLMRLNLWHLVWIAFIAYFSSPPSSLYPYP